MENFWFFTYKIYDFIEFKAKKVMSNSCFLIFFPILDHFLVKIWFEFLPDFL